MLLSIVGGHKLEREVVAVINAHIGAEAPAAVYVPVPPGCRHFNRPTIRKAANEAGWTRVQFRVIIDPMGEQAYVDLIR